MSNVDCSFIRPSAIPNHRPTFQRQTCRRRPRIYCGTPQDSSSRSQRESLPPIEIDEYEEHAPNPAVPPLGSPPSNPAFNGWDEIDDDYWHDFRKRELAFRAPTTMTDEDKKGPSHPLDRYGNPSSYSAAVKFDNATQDWIPTSEEEEEKLRNPHPNKDPYFIPEAEKGEPYTNIRRHVNSFVTGPDDDDSEFDVSDPEMFSRRIKDVSKFRRRRLGIQRGDWKVVHLGTSSAIPTRKRNVSSTAMVARPKSGEPSMFLVDVGENTEARLLACPWCLTHGFRWIRAIFITHLHGDHIFGLPSLLTKIGRYAQHRRRKAMEDGVPDTEPVIRIFGPYGTRGFVRSSLYWTNPVGVRFSVSELVPRDTDFLHVKASPPVNDLIVHDCESGQVRMGSGVDVNTEVPPPHPEEVRAEDIHVSDDGLWHVWEEVGEDMKMEVVSAPLRHRMPCFGYVFRELCDDAEESTDPCDESTDAPPPAHVANGTAHEFEIDTEKAKKLGVYGSQYRVLRSGRSITVSKTGLVVNPSDVAAEPQEISNAASNGKVARVSDEKTSLKKVTILGDTCDSSEIADAAHGSDLLVHEATFSDALKGKARVAMHSTARMAGAFGKKIEAKKVALTHFSSRYEFIDLVSGNDGMSNNEDGDDDDDLFSIGENEDEDLASSNSLVREAYYGLGEGDAEIVAAYDFLEHDVVSKGLGEGSVEYGVRRSEREIVSRN